jgi:hypothetical protein
MTLLIIQFPTISRQDEVITNFTYLHMSEKEHFIYYNLQCEVLANKTPDDVSLWPKHVK